MSYQLVPLPASANATFSAVLDGQDTSITLTTTDSGLFADVAYNGVQVISARLCLDRVDLNPNRYRGMPQALFFADTQGVTDPVWTGFNSRYVLAYGDPDINGGSVVA